MKKFRIYSHVNKSLLYDQKTGSEKNGYRDMEILEFNNMDEAQNYKDEYLNAGNYPDHPHSVLEIVIVN